MHPARGKVDYSASIVGGASNSCSVEVKQTVIALLPAAGLQFQFLNLFFERTDSLVQIGDELGELEMEIQKVGVRHGSVFDQQFVVASSGHSRESYHEPTLVGPPDFRKAREGGCNFLNRISSTRQESHDVKRCEA